jgi:3-methyladenine DNA glycosylase AlkD
MKHARLINKLILELERVSNRKTAHWWENYIKHNAKFRGVPLPVVRGKLKDWYKNENISTASLEEQLEMALDFFSLEYSEDKIAGILFLQLYLYDKFKHELLLGRFEELFQKGYIFDWNITDWFCIRVLRNMIKDKGMACAGAIAEWKRAENLWQARSSVVAFANNLVKEYNEYIPMILEASAVLIVREERFAKTAVGWLLREISNVEKASVVDFIDTYKDHFSKESLENSIKYFDRDEKREIRKI